MRFDGTLTDKMKDSVIKSFQKSGEGIRVMLVTSAAGGVGLNLQTATSIIIDSPEWSPAKEEQLIGHAYRIRQINTVHVFRLVAKYSMNNEFLGNSS
jgi:SNF2 family DNA or RNA helicase